MPDGKCFPGRWICIVPARFIVTWLISHSHLKNQVLYTTYQFIRLSSNSSKSIHLLVIRHWFKRQRWLRLDAHDERYILQLHRNIACRLVMSQHFLSPIPPLRLFISCRRIAGKCQRTQPTRSHRSWRCCSWWCCSSIRWWTPSSWWTTASQVT